jgi:hypothetical protein
MALGMGKLADDALVFPDPLTGAPQSPRAFTKRWSRVSRRVASGVRWHSLRHLHASLLVHHGIATPPKRSTGRSGSKQVALRRVFLAGGPLTIWEYG